ncbi:MAG: hypothetical protein MJZ00_05775 [Paludibacteraceae bacterium]|nr:hypothetical protein [Paludibacteraceae bacterium]
MLLKRSKDYSLINFCDSPAAVLSIYTPAGSLAPTLDPATALPSSTLLPMTL